MIPLPILIVALKASPKAALSALWASIRRKRVRARNIVYAAAQQDKGYYPLWIAAIEAGKVAEYCGEPATGDETLPIVPVVVSGQDGATQDLARTVESLRAALGNNTPIYCDAPGACQQTGCLELPGGSLNQFLDALSAANPEAWLLPMLAGDEIAPFAGKAIARALAKSSEAAIIYWDEDSLDGPRRHNPWLKPDWDELLFLARDGLTGAGVFQVTALRDPNGGSGLEPVGPRTISQAVVSLVGRTGANPAAIHVPLILSHRQPQSVFATAADRKKFMEKIWHEPVELTEIAGVPDALRPRFMGGKPLPKVSILIPTRNRHELLRICMAGVFRLEYGGDVEIIVVDNDSDEPASRNYLDELATAGVNIIRYSGPFNFSAMNNRAAEVATGEILCLLNNDIEMHDGAWLEAMVRHAMRPGVGAVGALLQYPDGTVQHAGVAVGTGNAAGHVYRGLSVEDAGHRDMHRLTRRVSAVTAACLVVRKDIFMEIGGLDETAFKVAFNDVDFCMRLSAHGYRNVLAGEALLTHHESKSRGSDFSTENFGRYSTELAYLQERWGTKEFVDPYHHPLAMRSSEKFVLAS